MAHDHPREAGRWITQDEWDVARGCIRDLKTQLEQVTQEREAEREHMARFLAEKHAPLIDRYNSAAGSLVELQERYEAAQEVIRELDLLFQSLTPGGSEFVNHPERCVEWALRMIESSHKSAIQAVKELNQLEAALLELVDLKDRVQYEDKADYERRKPLAWDKARKLVKR